MGVPQLKFPVAESHTPCMALYALLERALQDGDHDPYDNDIVQIGNALMASTKSFGMLFVVLDERLEHRDYAGALQVGAALVEHEALLLDVACGKPVRHASTVN
ncbi:hypothetical protein [Methylobacterium sp. SD21]|uniref:hypothetical protein n=1 Tax=Methylobacterium litchii TaxID=3138810 RepID=UPI00313E9F3C